MACCFFPWMLLSDHGYQNSKTWQEVCKGLMTDPTWNWVFKNTFDAMEEQLNKVSIEHFRWAFFWTSSVIWWPIKQKLDLTQYCQIHNTISIFLRIRESSYILRILQVLFALAALVILVRFISNLASGPNKSPIILRNNFSQFLVYFKIISKSHLLTFFSKFWSISNKSPIKNAITAILMQTSPRWRLRMSLTIL